MEKKIQLYRHKAFKVALALFCVSLVSGCASKYYSHVKPGKLSGNLIVEWMAPDRFLFIPGSLVNGTEPLVFSRDNGTEIQPERFYTDGGSIPRAFWALKNYSPWGYGPAFIVHDWLFHMQDCEISNWKNYDIEEAALVMSEVMKTLMESPEFNYGDKTTVYLMNKAVQSPPAQKAWNDKKCQLAPAPEADSWRPDTRVEFEF